MAYVLQKVRVLVRGGVLHEQRLYRVVNEVCHFLVFGPADCAQFFFEYQFPELLRAVSFQPVLILLAVSAAEPAKVLQFRPELIKAFAYFQKGILLIRRIAHIAADLFGNQRKQSHPFILWQAFKVRFQIFFGDILK